MARQDKGKSRHVLTSEVTSRRDDEVRPLVSLYHLLEHHAEKAPDHVAFLAPGQDPLRYGPLFERVQDAIRTLRRLGLRRTDRVAIVAPNGSHMAVALLAVAAGAIAVPLDPRYAADEWHRHLQALRIRALLVQGEFAPLARQAAERLELPIVELWPVLGQAGVFELSGTPWAPAVDDERACAEHDALVLPTSGTTSQPKAVPLTHANLCHSIRNTRAVLSLTPDDRLLCVLGLCHAHGIISGLFTTLEAGSSMVCTPAFAASEFLPWLSAFRPSWYTAVPTIHQAVLAQVGRRRHVTSSLRLIRSASAPMPGSVLADLERIFGVPVIEAYGMTEGASQVASNPLPPGERKVGSAGLPAGPSVAIMDPAGSLLPPGERGEIVLRGASVTRGYSDNPEANRAAFTDGWLHTGDHGYFDPDGYLFIVGRSKEIINRGGEKVAPREVEEAIASHPDVAQVVAFALPHPRLGEDVAAVVVARPGADPSARDLRRHAAERLVSFKVPRLITFVAEIPLGPTGKMQRLGLAEKLGLAGAPVDTRPRRKAARTELERWLVEVWTEVLAIDGIGVDADFFRLGGDSLMAAQIIARIGERRGAVLTFDDFFEAPTIAEQAKRFEGGGPAGSPDVGLMPIPYPDAGPVALAFAQLRLHLLERLGLGRPHHVVTAMRIDGALDVPALERSLAGLIARHEILRTTISDRDGEPLQSVQAAMRTPLARVDLGHCRQEHRDEAIVRAARATLQEPFDLGAGPLLKAQLLAFAQDCHALVLVTHHLVIDGWSQRLFWQELAARYEAEAAGRSPVLSAPPLQYEQFARWQRQWLGTETADRQRAYWKAQLDGLVALPLPTDHPRPARWSCAGTRHPIRLSRRLTRRLKTLSADRGATLFMTLLAGFLTVLHRYTGHDDLALGTLVACRRRIELERLMGPCVNPVVLRTNLSASPTFDELLLRVRRVTLGAFRHQELPFEQVLQDLDVPRTPDRNPLFQVLFMLHGGGGAAPRLPRLEVKAIEIDPGTARFDLMLELKEIDGCVHGWFEYALALFEQNTIARMAGHLETVLTAAATDPTRPIARLSLLTALERSALRHYRRSAWSGRMPRATLHRLFARQAARTPDAIALRCRGRSLTFEELNARANQVADHLRRRSIRPGQLVGLQVERDLEMVVGLLGILKSGAAYVPLDPTWPQKRLGFMAEHAELAALVTHRGLATGFARPDACVIRLDTDWHAISSERPDDPADDQSADSPAYVLYTSGSSGQPKGVVGTHRGVVNALAWTWRTFPFAEGEACCHRTSISFGDSIQELFAPLLQGVSVAILGTEDVTDARSLIRTLREHRVGRIILVPSLLRMLLDCGANLDRELPHLRLWTTSGELLPGDLAARFHQALPSRRLINIYGASEMSDTVTWHEVETADAAHRSPPIGRPIANTEVFVLGDDLEAMPVGIPGELCVAGAGLARGYLRSPELNAERFVSNPFGGSRYPRLYRTGDLARFLPDGRLEYLGRKDHQVQIRGCRVELDEVERVLSAHPLVRQAVVVARETRGGDTRLTAFLLARGRAAPDIQELVLLARGSLPAYMLPSEYVVLEAMPVTPSGKVDRRALAGIDAAGGSARPSPAAPRTPTEQILVGIWQELLGHEGIGVTDNFFEVGGHSLVAGQIVARVERRLGVSLPLGTVFDAPTVAELAREVEVARALPSQALSAIERATGSAPIPASIDQDNILRVEVALPGLPFSNLPYAFRLRGKLDARALDQSLAEVVRRHEALRTTFTEIDGRWVHVVGQAPTTVLEVDDLEALPPRAQQSMLELTARTQARSPIDVHAEPPLRVRLLRLSPLHHVLLVTVHHVVIDGWSLGIVLEEVSLLYTAISRGLSASLPEVPLQGTDFAQWQRAWCASEEAVAQFAYWRARLQGIEPVFGPGGPGGWPRMSLRTASIGFRLPAPLVGLLQDVSSRQSSSVFMALLAAFEVALHAGTGRTDLCIATVLANRATQKIERVVGLIEQTSLIRTVLEENMSFPEVLGRVRDAVLEAQAHQDLPLAELARKLEQEGGGHLFSSLDVLFVFQNAARHSLRLPDVRVEAIDEIERQGQAPVPYTQTRLTLILRPDELGIAGCCNYKADQLATDLVEELLTRYVAVLSQVVKNPDTSLHDLAIGPPPQAHQRFEAQAAPLPPS